MKYEAGRSPKKLLNAPAYAFIAALILFFISGACGLLYQVVWTRRLVLLFGTNAYAVSTVLSVFFLGLALGSLWGGRLADRSRRPLFWYAVMEFVIGLWAVLFIFTLAWGEGIVVTLLQWAGGERSLDVALRTVLAAVFLIVPVTLMGATLPLLARYVIAHGPVSGSRIGALYSVNTLGAVAGSAVTGFALVAAFGYTRTTFIGAALNIGIGLIALVLSRRTEPMPGRDVQRASETADETRAAAPGSKMAWLVMAAFGISGFCALAFEVLWTRLLAVVFLGTTYAFTTMLTTVLCGIAIGSAAAAFFVDRLKYRGAAFGFVQLLTAAACLGMLLVFPALPAHLQEMQADGGYEWTAVIRAKIVLSFLVLLLPTFLLGMSFPLALKAYADSTTRVGRDVGRLYASNTAGGVLGALAGGYVLIPYLGTHDGVVVLAALLGATGFALVTMMPGPGLVQRWALAGGGAAAIAAVAAYLPSDVSRALNRSFLPEDHEVIHYAEGVEGTVVVSAPKDDRRGTNRVLWINAVQATASIEKGVKMNRFQAVLPFLFDRDIDRVLFMCFGSGVTAGTLGISPLERVDAVEISEDVLEAAPLFGRDNFDVHHNPRIRPIVDDGRNYLLRTENAYDLITFEPMPLALAGVSAFYTREYYELCRKRLAPGGLVSQWVPLHNGLDLETVRDLFKTFVEVFPECSAWFVNADMFLIGSNEPLTIDYEMLERRLAENERLREGLHAVSLADPVELLASFFMGKENLSRFVAQARVMSDDRPWAEFVAPKLIYNRNVADVLAALQPYREPVLPLVRLPEGPRGQQVQEAILRRHRAHLQDMEGLKIYYGAGPFSSPEDEFRVSLQIDPEDANAKYYLTEILLARGRMFTSWDELDKAIPMLEEAAGYAPNRPDVQLALGDAYLAAGETAKAREAYQTHLALGGAAARAKDALKAQDGAVTD